MIQGHWWYEIVINGDRETDIDDKVRTWPTLEAAKEWANTHGQYCHVIIYKITRLEEEME